MNEGLRNLANRRFTFDENSTVKMEIQRSSLNPSQILWMIYEIAYLWQAPEPSTMHGDALIICSPLNVIRILKQVYRFYFDLNVNY